MRRVSLKNRLAAYLKRNYSHRWIASGDLQRVVAAATAYTPQNVGRRLRELENAGEIEVRYGKNHAYYRFRDAESIEAQIKRGLEWFARLPASLSPHPLSVSQQ